jgi:acyl carrier protein
MIPSMFVRLDAMPLTPSGKVDRKALRPPTIDRAAGAYVPPRTDTERMVAALWAEMLGTERVGAEDRFLELGGHSLIAMRVVGRLRRELGISVPLDPLLRGDTVAQFAALIEAARAAPVVPAAAEPALAPVARDSFRRAASPTGGRA